MNFRSTVPSQPKGPVATTAPSAALLLRNSPDDKSRASRAAERANPSFNAKLISAMSLDSAIKPTSDEHSFSLMAAVDVIWPGRLNNVPSAGFFPAVATSPNQWFKS
jgi:hypothetical protein